MYKHNSNGMCPYAENHFYNGWFSRHCFVTGQALLDAKEAECYELTGA